MTIKLPPAIANYFAADASAGARALASCFSPDAVVIDEGNSYQGHEAIEQWIAGASQKYTYTVEPFSVVEDNGHITVTSHLVGNFPGSPVDLRYDFVLEGDRIARLKIAP